MSGDVGDDQALLASLEAMRIEIAASRANLDAAEEIAETLEHRERYLRLGRARLDAHEQSLDDVERELQPQSGRRRAG
jgi:hypothetical protein